LHRNFVAAGNELDIVAFDCSTNQIVFVEVKTLADDFFQMPYQEVNMKKQKKIIRAANSYLIRYNIDKEARFDVISIVKRENADPQIEHIISAFTAFDSI
jgi:putative endonuclease